MGVAKHGEMKRVLEVEEGRDDGGKGGWREGGVTA